MGPAELFSTDRLGWSHVQRLFAGVCLLGVIFKVTLLFFTRKDLLRSVEAFPGPPAHWLFGNVREDENQQGLSDADIQAEVDTFMFEGHDTTANGITFILYCLACNPEHQKKCREEIIQALDGKDTLEWQDLTKIPYTTMCIKESLHLYPPVPGIFRKLTKPMTFFDGRTLPAGCRVGVSVFALHRNATVWKNPNVFDPLRYLPENVSKRPPHSFIPFAAGPRCADT